MFCRYFAWQNKRVAAGLDSRAFGKILQCYKQVVIRRNPKEMVLLSKHGEKLKGYGLSNQKQSNEFKENFEKKEWIILTMQCLFLTF